MKLMKQDYEWALMQFLIIWIDARGNIEGEESNQVHSYKDRDKMKWKTQV